MDQLSDLADLNGVVQHLGRSRGDHTPTGAGEHVDIVGLQREHSTMSSPRQP
jgi:hypothetical protein